MQESHSLIAEAAEKGRAGVRSLAATLVRVHAADCRAVTDELADGQDLSPYERQHLERQLLQLNAEFSSRMAVLDELSATYDALAEAEADPRNHMSIAIDLAQTSLRLQKLFHEVQAADADRLFV